MRSLLFGVGALLCVSITATTAGGFDLVGTVHVGERLEALAVVL